MWDHSIAQLAVPASQALSLSLHGVLFILSKHHVSSTCLASACASSQPESLGVATNCSTAPEVFWCISVYGDLTNAAQLRSIRWNNMCMSLAKNPSSCVLSHACFSRTSFLLCLLQQNIPSWVCLSLSPVSTSGKHFFTCLPQQNTIQHNWLSKEPSSFHFTHTHTIKPKPRVPLW